MSSEKEALIRHLLKEGIRTNREYYAAFTPEVADTMSSVQLLGTAQATIVTCVESWAKGRSLGFDDAAIAIKITKFRNIISRDSVDAAIDNILLGERGMPEYFELCNHFAYCKQEAKRFYGIE